MQKTALSKPQSFVSVIVPSIGYSVQSLQKDKIENLEKELESQTKLFNLKLNKLSNNIENFDTIQQLTFENVETKVLVNAKTFVDINKNIENTKKI